MHAYKPKSTLEFSAWTQKSKKNDFCGGLLQERFLRGTRTSNLRAWLTKTIFVPRYLRIGYSKYNLPLCVFLSNSENSKKESQIEYLF